MPERLLLICDRLLPPPNRVDARMFLFRLRIDIAAVDELILLVLDSPATKPSGFFVKGLSTAYS